MSTKTALFLFAIAVSGGLAQTTPQATPAPTLSKEQIDEIKTQNAKAQSMNALIIQATNAMNAKNWQAAIAPLEQLVVMDPTNWQFLEGLGNAQLQLGRYQDATQTYEKGIQAAQKTVATAGSSEANAKTARNPQDDPLRARPALARMLTNQGTAYLKLRRNNEAIVAYKKAAAIDPNPATAYFNLCAVQYNAGDVDGSLESCDKAISLDPNKADAYFIKGSLLLTEAKTDADGKLMAPPGTVEALNKYLELAPNGSHAADVKAMLEAIGTKVSTTYRKKK